jgi:hypothetical protein
MKTKLFLLFFFLIFISSINAQSIDTSKSYLNDNILNRIIPALPQGWSFYDKTGEFCIELADSVLIADKSKLNVANNKKIQDDSIIKFGFKTKSMITFRYESRWTYEQSMKAKSSNLQVYQLLKKLPEKYKITSLLDKTKSTRGNNVYTGTTNEEKELVKKYEKEKSELLAKIIATPSYNTENYSLFLQSTQGCSDDYYSVYPASSSVQLYQILALFSELAEK